MRMITVLAAGAIASACAAHSEQIEMLDIDFSNQQAAAQWYPVNDGVMGGRSSGGPKSAAQTLVFEGVINTNGGGFSSIRAPVDGASLADASAIEMRVKSDGRAYKLTMRTDQTIRGREISFQAPIPMSKSGEWANVSIELDGLEASMFGRRVTGVPFERAKTQSIGIILADGVDGPFRLEVSSIKGVKQD